MIWYLVSMDDGIIDAASTKRSLMTRNGYTTSVKEGSAYLVGEDASDGIGRSLYMIKDSDMQGNGFEWAINKYRAENENKE